MSDTEAWYPIPIYLIKGIDVDKGVICFHCVRHMQFAEDGEEWVCIADEHFCRNCYDQVRQRVASLMRDCIDIKIPLVTRHIMCDIEMHGEFRRLPCHIIEHYLRCATHPSMKYNRIASIAFIRSLWSHLYYGTDLISTTR